MRSSDAEPFAWQSKLDEPCPQVYDSGDVKTSPASRAAALQSLASGEEPGSSSPITGLFETASVRYPLRALRRAGADAWYGGGQSGMDRIAATPAEGVENTQQLPAQWMDVDLRDFDYGMLGKVDVILADPP